MKAKINFPDNYENILNLRVVQQFSRVVFSDVFYRSYIELR